MGSLKMQDRKMEEQKKNKGWKVQDVSDICQPDLAWFNSSPTRLLLLLYFYVSKVTVSALCRDILQFN